MILSPSFLRDDYNDHGCCTIFVLQYIGFGCQYHRNIFQCGSANFKLHDGHQQFSHHFQCVSELSDLSEIFNWI